MRILFLFIIMISVYQLQAQIDQVSIGQISATPYINPGFAGSTGNLRAFYSIHYSDYKYKSGTYTMKPYEISLNNFGSVDLFVKKISSGIGFSYIHSNSLPDNYPMDSKFQNDELRFTLAPKISIKGKITISPAVSMVLYHSHQTPYNTFYDGLGLNKGLLINSRKGYIGINHIRYAKGKYTWEGSLHMGYTFQEKEDSKFTFTPSILWEFNNATAFYADKRNGRLKNLLLPDNA